jgi:hypothetical protein
LLGRAFLGKDGWETHIQYVPRMEYVHDYCKHEIDEIIEKSICPTTTSMLFYAVTPRDFMA